VGSQPGITASLNNGAAQPNLHFTNLDAGTYLLSVIDASACRFDSVITVSKLISTPPVISLATTDQVCFVPNGKVNIAATGPGSPFTFSLNNSTPGQNQEFTNLSPGIYPVTVTDKYKCRWNSSVEIVAYLRVPVTVDVATKDPDCKTLNSGHVILRMSGAEAPYTTSWQNNSYPNASPVLLGAGQYTLPVINRDGCVVDSAKATLTLIMEPECDRMLMPNAFSPDGNGKNDRLKPIHGPFLRNVKLVIYNRYGQVVFRSTDTETGWDGTTGGRPAASGTYVWTLNYETYSGEQRMQKGQVLLVR
jgi:gliding motility-associated-like protein